MHVKAGRHRISRRTSVTVVTPRIEFGVCIENASNVAVDVREANNKCISLVGETPKIRKLRCGDALVFQEPERPVYAFQ